MDNIIEQKAIYGFIELLSDIRFICGKAEDVQFKPYMKAVLNNPKLAQTLIGTSPEEMKGYIDYANLPVELRK